jgi:hypothetical protein
MTENKWTEIDRITYTDLAHDIAFAVADGRQPDNADVARFRKLTNKRDAHLGVDASFKIGERK